MSDVEIPEYPCPKRHPSSGHFCERQAPHDGDHWTYDQRAWREATEHEHRWTGPTMDKPVHCTACGEPW